MIHLDYLYQIIIDHKTNAKIDLKGFYNTATRSSDKMKYPNNSIGIFQFLSSDDSDYKIKLSKRWSNFRKR